MWVRLASEQLSGPFPDPLRYLRADEAAVIEEKLQCAQI